MEKSFEKLYLRFRANYYRRMVELIGVREGSLNATEAYCLEIIYLLGRPTVSQFAAFLGISLSNANYKINGMVQKGYVLRVPSTTDRREAHLEVTDKFLSYYGLKDRDIAHLMRRIRETFTLEEVRSLEGFIDRIERLMTEEDTEP